MKGFEEMELGKLLGLRDSLLKQKEETESDIDEVKSEIEKRVDAGGREKLDKDGKATGSKIIDYIREDGKLVPIEVRFSDSISLHKKKDVIKELESVGIWDIFKEDSIDPGKIRTLRDEGKISDASWERICKSRGSFSLVIGKPRDLTEEEEGDAKMKKEAEEVFG